MQGRTCKSASQATRLRAKSRVFLSKRHRFRSFSIRYASALKREASVANNTLQADWPWRQHPGRFICLHSGIMHREPRKYFRKGEAQLHRIPPPTVKSCARVRVKVCCRESGVDARSNEEDPGIFLPVTFLCAQLVIAWLSSICTAHLAVGLAQSKLRRPGNLPIVTAVPSATSSGVEHEYVAGNYEEYARLYPLS